MNSAVMTAMEDAPWEIHDADLRCLVDSLNQGLLFLSRSGSIQLVNAAGKAILKALDPQVENGRLVSLSGIEVPELIESVLQGPGRTVAAESGTLATGRKAYNVVFSPVRSRTGEITGVLVLLRDITSERALQEQLWQSEKLASVGQLVSGVAHELNNPLTAVLGYAQLLPRTLQLDGQALDIVQRVVKEADRARRIVQNLLAFARKQKPVKTWLQVNDVIEQTLELRGYDLRVNNIEVEKQLSPDLPKTVGDTQQLQQVFLNMINNAADSMLAAAGRGRLSIQSRIQDDRIQIRFQDTGPGVPAADARKIFDPFFTTKPVGQGTGLGLAISYGIITEHHGTITLANSGSPGALFVIELPVVIASDCPSTAPVQTAVATTPEPMTKSILLVEDEEVILQLMRHVLAREGFECRTAGNGLKALEQFRENHFDLVITDIQMPEMDGQALFRELVKLDAGMARRVIFLTGDASIVKADGFFVETGARCLEKPFRVDQLRAAVKSFFEEMR